MEGRWSHNILGGGSVSLSVSVSKHEISTDFIVGIASKHIGTFESPLHGLGRNSTPSSHIQLGSPLVCKCHPEPANLQCKKELANSMRLSPHISRARPF